MTYRNRMVVAGANGAIILSIPLEDGRNQRKAMKDVRIANGDSWQSRHWKTLTSCYNRSPWFEYYKDGLEGLYRTRYTFLADWNITCHQWVSAQLQMKTEFLFEREPLTPEPNWVDSRNLFRPKTIAASSFKGPEYRQVFQERNGFTPGLSILDLLFCEGPNAGNLLGDKNTE